MRTSVSCGFVPATHVLQNDDVSVGNEGVRTLSGVFFVVGRAHQNYGKLAVNHLTVLGGAVDVSGEFDSVAHGDHYVFRFGDAVASIGLSTGRNAYGEHSQHA